MTFQILAKGYCIITANSCACRFIHLPVHGQICIVSMCQGPGSGSSFFSIQKSDTYSAQDSNPYKNLHKSRILGSIDLQFLCTAATMLRYKYGCKFQYISEVGMWVFRDIQLSLNRLKSKMISNDQELIQSDPTSCPQNQKGNN